MIAVIGKGDWAQAVAAALRRLGVLSMRCDADATDVLARDAVKGVVVAVPAENRHALVEAALRAGKHVLVEHVSARSGELVALAAKAGVVFMSGDMPPCHPLLEHLAQAVRGGKLGRIDGLHAGGLVPGNVPCGEGALGEDMASDVARVLTLGDTDGPCRVAAAGDAEISFLHLDFPSGLKAHVSVFHSRPVPERKLVVLGEAGTAVFDDARPWADKLLFYPRRSGGEGGEPERAAVPEADPLALLCARFMKGMGDKVTAETLGRDWLAVAAVLEAGRRSLEQAGRPVALSAGFPAADAPFVHETALVDKGVDIGPRARIWHFSHVLSGSRIGARTNIGQNVVVGPDVTIGKGCKVQNNVSVYKGVTLEDDVFCGPSMVFTNVMNPRAHINRRNEFRPTLVRQGASLGANCTIVCGRVVGRYAFIGAGAVVTRDVPDHALVVGNPARRIGWMCACGTRLGNDLVCADCGRIYRETPRGLTETASEEGCVKTGHENQ